MPATYAPPMDLDLGRLFDDGFAAVMQRIADCFYSVRSHVRAGAYLQGLLAPVDRKNGWQLAEASGDTNPRGMQQFLLTSSWEADAVRDQLQRYVSDYLGDPDGVLIVDETGFLKKGTKSAGVQRQYSGTAGRVENCQIGVFLAYAGSRGGALIDRALYLPKGWLQAGERCREAGIPVDTTFATKPTLAICMLERAFDNGIPAAWVAGDTVYGQDPTLRHWLEDRQQPYILAVPKSEAVRIAGQRGSEATSVEVLADWLSADAWSRLSAGAGSKGLRLYDWAKFPLADEAPTGFRHWVLIRRQLDAPHELAFFRVFAPEGTSLPTMVKVAGSRWAIEVAFEGAKQETGLGHYEVRSWTGWYRHVTLAMLAYALLVVMKVSVRAVEAAQQKGPEAVTEYGCP